MKPQAKIKLVIEDLQRMEKKVERLEKEKTELINDNNSLRISKDNWKEKFTKLAPKYNRIVKQNKEVREQYAHFIDTHKNLLKYYNDHRNCDNGVEK